jgi:hypothetical protein
MPTQTVFEVSWGSSDVPQERRYFTCFYESDAVFRFAEKVLELDHAPANAAYAALRRLPDTVYPDGMHLAAWTKTSDERPTGEGSIEIPPDPK